MITYQGDVRFDGSVTNNGGVIMGNIGPSSGQGLTITGSTNVRKTFHMERLENHTDINISIMGTRKAGIGREDIVFTIHLDRPLGTDITAPMTKTVEPPRGCAVRC
jgi:hypothetical protein